MNRATTILALMTALALTAAAGAQSQRDLRAAPAERPGTGPIDQDETLPLEDQVILDDLIVDGSICVGLDCVNGESFGFDTIRLKENNLRIRFVDTSSSASFPTNDWQITINDSSNGGQNKFSIDDIDGGRTPFTIEASAPSHSLYVDDGGRIGLGTSTPVVEAHMKDGNTPTLRLEQDGSSGFTPQTWDVAGNEANFFIRDATNGSKLPFRIRPGANSNSIVVDTNSEVGLGTSSPEARLHAIADDGSPALLVEEQSSPDGLPLLYVDADGIGMGTSNPAAELHVVGPNAAMFTITNTVAEFGVGASWVDVILPDGRFALTKAGTGQVEMLLDSMGNMVLAGALTDSSDVNAKRDIEPVDGASVLERLEDVPISEWSYRADENGTRHMGPMAQDFHAAFGLGVDDLHLAPLDTGGVALAAIKELNERNEALARENATLSERLEVMERQMAELARLVGEK